MRVSQAEIQGLEDNLAFYVARFGLQEVENPHAPRIFEDGKPKRLLEAVKKYVDMELIAEARGRTRGLPDRVHARSRQCTSLIKDPAV
ncbi:ML3 [Symbiodinium pilosum]|uniref:ML3 protein n=1 Tax=Symbiodinium pilosum TaxID=2952 RepID=A0A812TD12_SYMPI|nr:ML3 [Symbiodinium pilosum]